jgi:hypothetical protein
MAITKLHEEIEIDGKKVFRRVEERTSRVEINTPLNEAGVAGYHFVIYREWVEYISDVAVKITKLPPFSLPLRSSILTTAAIIANKIDDIARQRTLDLAWPKDDTGNIIEP